MTSAVAFVIFVFALLPFGSVRLITLTHASGGRTVNSLGGAEFAPFSSLGKHIGLAQPAYQ